MSNWRGKSGWSVASRVASASLIFLFNVILTHSVSQNEIGLYFLGLSVSWGGALVCQWGSTILAVKWIATAHARQDLKGIQRAVWSLISYTILQGLVVAGCILTIKLFKPLTWQTVVIWSVWTFAVGLRNLMPEIFRGFDDIKWASLFGGPIPNLFGLTILSLAHFAFKRLSFQQAAALTITADLLCAVIAVAMISLRAPVVKIPFVSYQNYLQEATPIGLSLVAIYALAQADLWICGVLLPHEDVAVYGIAQRFSHFISMPLVIFGAIVTPTMAEYLAKNDLERLKSVVARGTLIVTLCASGALILGALFGWPVIRYLIGVSYSGAYPLFLIIGLGHVVYAVIGPNGYLLLLSGEQRWVMYSTITATAVLFSLATIGAHFWGTKGVATASALSLVVQSAMMWAVVKRRLNVTIHLRFSDLRKPAA